MTNPSAAAFESPWGRHSFLIAAAAPLYAFFRGALFLCPLRFRRGRGGVAARRHEILIFSGSQGELPNEPLRDWLARQEGDAGLRKFEPGRGNVAGMRFDGGRSEIKTTLLAESCIARDDGLPDPEPRHVVGDDFFGVRQRARKLGAQSIQQGAEVLRSLSYIGIVISNHGQSTLPLA